MCLTEKDVQHAIKMVNGNKRHAHFLTSELTPCPSLAAALSSALSPSESLALDGSQVPGVVAGTFPRETHLCVSIQLISMLSVAASAPETHTLTHILKWHRHRKLELEIYLTHIPMTHWHISNGADKSVVRWTHFRSPSLHSVKRYSNPEMPHFGL